MAAMMRCEAARLNFEEEMRSVLLVAGLFFLGILAVNAMADAPLSSFADLIAGRISHHGGSLVAGEASHRLD